jgi:hypothetical protein
MKLNLSKNGQRKKKFQLKLLQFLQFQLHQKLGRRKKKAKKRKKEKKPSLKKLLLFLNHHQCNQSNNTK